MTMKTQPEDEPSSVLLTALRSWVKDFEEELQKKDLEEELEKAYKVNLSKYILAQGKPNHSKSKYEEA